MTNIQADYDDEQSDNPIDILEAMFQAREWAYERLEDDDELVVDTTGGWCDYRMFFAWCADLHALYFTCTLNLKIPKDFQKRTSELLMLINQKMGFGHFDLCPDNGELAFRHTIPARGIRLSPEQIEDTMDIGLVECERFYPAFQLLVWANHSPAKAVANALLDCRGEA